MDTKSMGQTLSTITMFVPITIVFIAIVLLLLGKLDFLYCWYEKLRSVSLRVHFHSLFMLL